MKEVVVSLTKMALSRFANEHNFSQVPVVVDTDLGRRGWDSGRLNLMIATTTVLMISKVKIILMISKVR